MPEEYKDKISEDDAKKIKEAVEEARKSLTDADADKEKYESALKALNEILMPIGAKMYQNTTTDAKEGEKVEDAKADDDAVEGEVVDKE